MDCQGLECPEHTPQGPDSAGLNETTGLGVGGVDFVVRPRQRWEGGDGF
jgi:hypothetical protein